MPTIEELKTQRRDWIKAAKEDGTLQALIDIAMTLGTYDAGKSSCSPDTYLYQSGDIMIKVKVGSSGYLVGVQDRDWQTTIIVVVGEYQTCYVIDKKYDPEFIFELGHVFVPGKWVDKIMTQLPKAKAVLGKSSHEESQRELRELEKRLLIGIDV